MPFSDWPKTLADAKTILGNSAKIPSGKMPGVLKNKDDYKKFKINFGKDRCGNPPRPPKTSSNGESGPRNADGQHESVISDN